MGSRIRQYDANRGNRQSPEYVKAYRENNPKKYAAHNAVSYALRKGTLIPRTACEVCSSAVDLHAHHDDYDEPLIVRWLCPKCNGEWHSLNGEAANAH